MMARATLKRKPPDDFGPTQERLAKALEGDVLIGDDQQGGRIYTIQASPICRMFRDRRLDGTQFTALSRFHSHWWNAGLSESIRGVDLNRIYAPDPFTSAGMSRTEKQYHNRREYRAAYDLLTFIEGILVTNLICSETYTLEQCGHALGYNSPFRARAAATKVVCSIADRFAKLWGIS
jgi:hypothetical protein